MVKEFRSKELLGTEGGTHTHHTHTRTQSVTHTDTGTRAREQYGGTSARLGIFPLVVVCRAFLSDICIRKQAVALQ